MSNMSSDQASSRLYRAVWRWHFYAGLYVIPFLLMLSVTGFLMLMFTNFLPEFGDRLPIASHGTAKTPFEIVEAARSGTQMGAALKEFVLPFDANTPALIKLSIANADQVLAVDPYSGTILRTTPADATWNAWIEKIHGSLLIGDIGDRLIEVAASLGIVMVVTGLFMWWPRNVGFAQVAIPDFTARGRAAWKSWHSSLGFWFALIILGFMLTGLAWTGVWGAKIVQAWSAFPAEKFDAVPTSTVNHDEHLNHGGKKKVPWGIEQTPMPESMAHEMPAAEQRPDLNTIVELGRSLGILGRFRVTAPADDKGVWTLSQNSMSYDGSAPNDDRTVHVDQFTGKVLADVRYADYSPGAKAMAIGIALHEGQLGLWNVALNGLFCLAIMFLCVSGIVMWWKRRPAGELAAPRYARDYKIPTGALVSGAILALAFPLGGLAIALFAIIDVLLPKRLKEARAKAD